MILIAFPVVAALVITITILIDTIKDLFTN